MDAHESPTTQRIEISGPLDRADVELIQLEIRRLARRRGVDVRRVTIEAACDEGSDSP